MILFLCSLIVQKNKNKTAESIAGIEKLLYLKLVETFVPGISNFEIFEHAEKIEQVTQATGGNVLVTFFIELASLFLMSCIVLLCPAVKIKNVLTSQKRNKPLYTCFQSTKQSMSCRVVEKSVLLVSLAFAVSLLDK